MMCLRIYSQIYQGFIDGRLNGRVLLVALCYPLILALMFFERMPLGISIDSLHIISVEIPVEIMRLFEPGESFRGERECFPLSRGALAARKTGVYTAWSSLGGRI